MFLSREPAPGEVMRMVGQYASAVLTSSLRRALRRGSARRHASTAASDPWTLASVVDMEAYPLLDPGAVQAVVADSQQRLLAEGFCVLRRFVRPAAVAAAVQEVRRREDACFVHARRVNMFGETPAAQSSLPASSLSRLASPDMYGVVARDELSTHGPLQTLYASPAVAAFAASMAGCGQLHTMDDELAGCTAEILHEGQARSWQLAAGKGLVAVLMLQRPNAGGLPLVLPNAVSMMQQAGPLDEVVVLSAEDDGDGGNTAAVEAVRTVVQGAQVEREAADAGIPMSWVQVYVRRFVDTYHKMRVRTADTGSTQAQTDTNSHTDTRTHACVRARAHTHTFTQVMEDMDPEAGAVYHKKGPLAVQQLALSEGDVLLLTPHAALFRFSLVLGGQALLTSTFRWERAAQQKLGGNERKRLFGRKKAGALPLRTSTFAPRSKPLPSETRNGQVTEGRYVMMVSEEDGELREIAADGDLMELLDGMQELPHDGMDDDAEISLKELLAKIGGSKDSAGEFMSREDGLGTDAKGLEDMLRELAKAREKKR